MPRHVVLLTRDTSLAVALKALLGDRDRLTEIESPSGWRALNGSPVDAVVVDLPSVPRKAAVEALGRKFAGPLIVLLDPGEELASSIDQQRCSPLHRPFGMSELWTLLVSLPAEVTHDLPPEPALAPERASAETPPGVERPVSASPEPTAPRSGDDLFEPAAPWTDQPAPDVREPAWRWRLRRFQQVPKPSEAGELTEPMPRVEPAPNGAAAALEVAEVEVAEVEVAPAGAGAEVPAAEAEAEDAEVEAAPAAAGAGAEVPAAEAEVAAVAEVPAAEAEDAGADADSTEAEVGARAAEAEIAAADAAGAESPGAEPPGAEPVGIEADDAAPTLQAEAPVVEAEAAVAVANAEAAAVAAPVGEPEAAADPGAADSDTPAPEAEVAAPAPEAEAAAESPPAPGSGTAASDTASTEQATSLMDTTMWREADDAPQAVANRLAKRLRLDVVALLLDNGQGLLDTVGGVGLAAAERRLQVEYGHDVLRELFRVGVGLIDDTARVRGILGGIPFGEADTLMMVPLAYEGHGFGVLLAGRYRSESGVEESEFIEHEIEALMDFAEDVAPALRSAILLRRLKGQLNLGQGR